MEPNAGGEEDTGGLDIATAAVSFSGRSGDFEAAFVLDFPLLKPSEKYEAMLDKSSNRYLGFNRFSTGEGRQVPNTRSQDKEKRIAGKRARRRYKDLKEKSNKRAKIMLMKGKFLLLTNYRTMPLSDNESTPPPQQQPQRNFHRYI